MADATRAKNEAESTDSTNSEGRNARKVFVGQVFSDKMDKTRTVKVERRVPHARYGKIVRRWTTLKVHDEENESKNGDVVEVMECRPLSKTKRFRLVRIVTAAPSTK